MKNPRSIIVILLVIVAAALSIISVFAFAFAGANTAVTYPNATASGANRYYPNGMMGGYWSGMMGDMMDGKWGPSATVQTPVTAQNTVLPLIGLATLVGAVLTGAGGAVYYLAFPRIRIANAPPTTIVETPQNTVAPLVSVSKTLTAEERKVLAVLVVHDGKYLQKYIRAETGLSRLKIHRIIARLSERGIVTLEKCGNTNEVHLSSWLQNKPSSNVINDEQADNQELMVET